jgi:hypothetical protein
VNVKWNVPSAIVFALSVAGAIALFALKHAQEGALLLAIALGIAAPQPLRGEQ